MQFLIVIVISKTGGLNEIGTYGLITSIVIPITIFFLFDANNAVLAEKNLNQNLSRFIGNVIFNSLLAIPFILLFSFIFGVPVIYSIGFFLFRVSINIKEILFSYYQRLEEYKYLSINQLVMAFLVSLVFIIIYHLGYKSLTVFYACSAAVIFSYIIDYYLIKSVLKKNISFLKFDFIFMKSRFKSGFNLGSNALISSLKINAPKYFIQFTSQNLALIGVITVYTQIITGLSVLNLIYSRLNLGKVGNILVNKKMKSKKNLYKIISNNYFLIIAFALLLVSLESLLIGFFFGIDYTNNLNLFKTLLLIKLVTFPLVIFKVLSIGMDIEHKITQATVISSIILLVTVLFLDKLNYFLLFYLAVDILMMIYIFKTVDKSITTFFKS